MKLTVQLFAVLRERAGWSERVLDDLPDQLDVTGLERELLARHPEFGTFDGVRGVVDSTCRVFGLDNLFVAGASLFPTSGAMNPTLTLVALAHRLADRIEEDLR